jgi:hypothetical protein
MVNGCSYIKRYADADWNYEQALIIEVNQNFMEPICIYKKETTGALTETFRLYGNGSGFFAGRVGIGTTAYPDEMLHVVGNSYITGNVGIGTQNTFGYKLAVNGTIGAKKVIVETTGVWPDYVFEGEYKLHTLKELENYITTNKHLPEIPTAQEIQENGQDLGEMNVKLLQKVEELTLYIIEQQKHIEEIRETQQQDKEIVKNLQEKLNHFENSIK